MHSFTRVPIEVLEEPVKGHVNQLQAVLTIAISLAKKKSGGEKRRLTWTVPYLKPKSSMIFKS